MSFSVTTGKFGAVAKAGLKFLGPGKTSGTGGGEIGGDLDLHLPDEPTTEMGTPAALDV